MVRHAYLNEEGTVSLRRHPGDLFLAASNAFVNFKSALVCSFSPHHRFWGYKTYFSLLLRKKPERTSLVRFDRFGPPLKEKISHLMELFDGGKEEKRPGLTGNEGGTNAVKPHDPTLVIGRAIRGREHRLQHGRNGRRILAEGKWGTFFQYREGNYSFFLFFTYERLILPNCTQWRLKKGEKI